MSVNGFYIQLVIIADNDKKQSTVFDSYSLGEEEYWLPWSKDATLSTGKSDNFNPYLNLGSRHGPPDNSLVLDYDYSW